MGDPIRQSRGAVALASISWSPDSNNHNHAIPLPCGLPANPQFLAKSSGKIAGKCTSGRNNFAACIEAPNDTSTLCSLPDISLNLPATELVGPPGLEPGTNG